MAFREELTTRISNALAKDERTEDCVIEVVNEEGMVTLEGRVPNQETAQAALEIARNQPGVIKVVDSLIIDQNDEEANVTLTPSPNKMSGNPLKTP